MVFHPKMRLAVMVFHPKIPGTGDGVSPKQTPPDHSRLWKKRAGRTTRRAEHWWGRWRVLKAQGSERPLSSHISTPARPA